jgi:hypothetical protein
MEENKAIDERTKEDVEKMEKEEKLAIEKAFPSYFDEFQKLLFSGEVDPALLNNAVKRNREGDAVKVDKIMHIMLGLETFKGKSECKRGLVKLRLKMLAELYTSEARPSCSDWLQDVSAYLREELTQ